MIALAVHAGPAGRAGARCARPEPTSGGGEGAVTLATALSWGGFVVWRAERGLGGVGALWRRGSARSVHVPPRERAPCLPPGSCRGSAPTNAPTQGGVLLQLLFAGRNLF